MAHTTSPTDVSTDDLVRRGVEALNRHDTSVIRGSLARESEYRFPDRTCRGIDAIVAYFEDTLVAIPDLHLEIRAIASAAEDVFMSWYLTGTHGGLLIGIEPTGKPLAIDGLDHLVVRDGHIVSNFIVFDQMQYARQIGMMPPDGSAGDRALKAAFNTRTMVTERIKRRTG
jgi:predicted ester cyclase